MPIDSPLMQEVDRATAESLRIVSKALERDKKFLNKKIQNLESAIENAGMKYCAACGVLYEQFTRCDCTAGVDY